MSLNNDPLAAYRVSEEDEDPLAKYRQEENKPQPLDTVSEELRQHGYEPEASEEIERAEDIGRAEATRGVIKGITAGLSNLVPGLKTGDNIAAQGGELIGSVLPITVLGKAFSKPLVSLAQKSPVIQGYLSSLAKLTGTALTGAAIGGAQEATESGELKAPSVDNMLEHGATWAALDFAINSLGFGARFAKNLAKKAVDYGMSKVDLLNQVAGKAAIGSKSEIETAKKAMSILEGKPIEAIEKEIKPLKERKIEVHNLENLEKLPPEPYLPESFEAEKIAEEAISSDLEQSIENHARRASTEKELGENIKKDIEAQNKASRAETDELYEVARKGEENKFPNTKKTADSVLNQIKKIQKEGFKTNPEGYKKAENQLINFLEDLGYKPILDAGGKVGSYLVDKKIPLSSAVDLKKRLNKIINYDLLETGAQDFLKEPAALLREDIRKGYGPKKSISREAFEEAETKFGENAERMGKRSIKSARYSEKPETLAKQIRTASGLQDIKDAVSKEQFAQVERELLEHMKNLSESRAQGFYRELRPQLSQDARSIAEQIIESKAPIEAPSRKAAQRNKIQEMVTNDLSEATLTGERPSKTLNLWKTSEGQQLIKNSLEGNPNKEKVIKYLSEQSTKDMISSVVNEEGKINFKKLNDFLKNKDAVENIRLVGGDDAVTFFKNLEQISNRMKKNLSVIEGKIDKGSVRERKEITETLEKYGKQKFKKIKEGIESKEKSGVLYQLDDYLNSYGVKAKGLLAGLGIWKFGTAEGIAYTLIYEGLMRAAKNKRVRKAFYDAAQTRYDPKYIIKSLEEVQSALEES